MSGNQYFISWLANEYIKTSLNARKSQIFTKVSANRTYFRYLYIPILAPGALFTKILNPNSKNLSFLVFGFRLNCLKF